MNERPRYSTGTRIRLLDELASHADGASEFAIIARHFLNTTEPRYRIRSLSDFHKRTVREDDIVASADAMSREMGSSSKIVAFDGHD